MKKNLKKILCVMFAAIMGVSSCVCAGALNADEPGYGHLMPAEITPACYNSYGLNYLAQGQYMICGTTGKLICGADFTADNGYTCPYCGKSDCCEDYAHMYYGYECPYCSALTITDYPYTYTAWGECTTCGKTVFENTSTEVRELTNERTIVIDEYTTRTEYDVNYRHYNSAVYPECFGDVKIYRFVAGASCLQNSSIDPMLAQMLKDTATEYGDGFDLEGSYFVASNTGIALSYDADENNLNDTERADGSGLAYPDSGNSGGSSTSKSFWQKIADFFKSIFSWFGNLF